MAARKPTTSAADDNLDELFSGIGDTKKTPAASKAPKPSTAASKAMGDTDILADLESQLASATPTSRPHTPRLKETAIRRSAATPPAATPPAPDDKRKSTDSSRSLRASFTPSATSSELHEADKRAAPEPAQEPQEQATGGGWWGGIWNTANAAMKQAEAAYKEIQQNEEAKKWAEQVRGFSHLDVGALKTYGE